MDMPVPPPPPGGLLPHDARPDGRTAASGIHRTGGTGVEPRPLRADARWLVDGDPSGTVRTTPGQAGTGCALRKAWHCGWAPGAHLHPAARVAKTEPGRSVWPGPLPVAPCRECRRAVP